MKRRQRKQRKNAKKKTNHNYKEKPAQDNEDFKETFKINQALRLEDYALLREIGRKNGFISDAIRRRVWPFLLHCEDSTINKVIEGSLEVPHKDEEQVKLDVIRSFNSFPKNIDEEDKRKLEGQLNRVIVHVLRSYPSLHYYQGYHDICSVFILLFGEKYATKLMESVALFYLRDEMYINMEPVLKKLTILDTLIRLEDEELYHFITEAHVLPYYCLSWVITWCSHDLDNLETITRLFDLFLSSNPFMVIYFSAALVLSKRNEIVTLPAGDTSTIHTYLAKLPKSLDHVETLCQKACQLEEAYSVLELQYQSSVALDQVSTVNRFEQDWLPIKSLEDLNHTIQYQVIPILKDEKERLPIELKSNTNSEKKMNNDNSILQRLSHLNRKDALLYTLVTVSASVGLLAILVSNSDLIREWLLTGV